MRILLLVFLLTACEPEYVIVESQQIREVEALAVELEEVKKMDYLFSWEVIVEVVITFIIIFILILIVDWWWIRWNKKNDEKWRAKSARGEWE